MKRIMSFNFFLSSFSSYFFFFILFSSLSHFDASAAAMTDAAKTPVMKILFLGDSLTEGYGISTDKSYPMVIKNYLLKDGLKNIEIINAGESGSTSSSGPGRLKWQLKLKPHLLVLALGANDGLRGLDTKLLKSNLKKTIDLALENKIKVLLVGMKMPFNYGEEYQQNFNQVFTQLSEEYQGKITYLPFLLEGVGGIKKYNLPDGIHPNEKGHELMAKNVYRSLKQLLTP